FVAREACLVRGKKRSRSCAAPTRGTASPSAVAMMAMPPSSWRQQTPTTSTRQGSLPSLVQGHEAQHEGEGRGGVPGVRARQQGHRARHQALARPVPSRDATEHEGEGSINECTVRMFCSAGGEEYSVAARDGTVCLVPTDPGDDLQHWVKVMRRSTSIKDEDGYPAFALVNKHTGEAIKHSLGESHPVRLVRYDPDYLDESVLWTESEDVGDGFRCVRMVNNIHLNFDALDAGEGQGGVHDGTAIVLWEWCEGENQRWKILPWCE
uniref:PH domain-containing protein n=1 Tax=Aegilops tauschii subsp. strangulata TaxID=200361 RepID=A0A453TBC6_AEGTS